LEVRVVIVLDEPVRVRDRGHAQLGEPLVVLGIDELEVGDARPPVVRPVDLTCVGERVQVSVVAASPMEWMWIWKPALSSLAKVVFMSMGRQTGSPR